MNRKILEKVFCSHIVLPICNWAAIKASDVLSFSLCFKGEQIDKIGGLDEQLHPTMVITADTQNSGGTIVDTGLGVNIYSGRITKKITFWGRIVNSNISKP